MRICVASAKTTSPSPSATIWMRLSEIMSFSMPVPTIGASHVTSGTAWRIMFDPISARLASSCSKKGIRLAAIEAIWFGATSIRSTSLSVTTGGNRRLYAP